jgi:hypothetical protein
MPAKVIKQKKLVESVKEQFWETFAENSVFCMVVLSVGIHAMSQILVGLVSSFELLTRQWLTDWMLGQDILSHQQYPLTVCLIPLLVFVI